MKTADFDYPLPTGLIAQEPVEPRSASRLLILDRRDGSIEHRYFSDLPGFLRPGDCLVLNETRVMPARLIGRKPTGGHVEMLLLKPLADDHWEVMCRPARRLKAGARVEFGANGAPAKPASRGVSGWRLAAAVVEELSDGRRLVKLESNGPVSEAIERLGLVPLPPYIRRPLADAQRYQTVYASKPGSAAAPTAGLHFTPELLAELRAAGVQTAKISLDIGLDTFRPVQAENVEAHALHAEAYRVAPEAAAAVNRAAAAGGRIVAVGTTVVRALESAAAGGIPRETGFAGTPSHPLVAPAAGATRLFIYPGYRFKAVDALLTNFHLPRSSLLMLVSAFAGRERVLAAYDEAVKQRYRFYSFGDAMLIL